MCHFNSGDVVTLDLKVNPMELTAVVTSVDDSAVRLSNLRKVSRHPLDPWSDLLATHLSLCRRAASVKSVSNAANPSPSPIAELHPSVGCVCVCVC